MQQQHQNKGHEKKRNPFKDHTNWRFRQQQGCILQIRHQTGFKFKDFVCTCRCKGCPMLCPERFSESKSRCKWAHVVPISSLWTPITTTATATSIRTNCTTQTLSLSIPMCVCLLRPPTDKESVEECQSFSKPLLLLLQQLLLPLILTVLLLLLLRSPAVIKDTNARKMRWAGFHSL